MAIRPNTHITGDKSVRKISAELIPEEWTISIPDSDYGLDMLIEVVQDNKTTGHLFFIQSKGTEDSSNEGNISYSMSVDRIKDYAQISIPVLLVLYSKDENLFWGRWMNSLYSSLTEQQKEQSSITLHFSVYNEIDADYLRTIGSEIVPSITNRVTLYCDSIPEAFRLFHTQVLEAAHNFIGNNISDDIHLSSQSIELFYNNTLEDGYVDVVYENESIRVPIFLKSRDFLYYPNLTKEDSPSCLLDIIYAIAFFSSSVSTQSLEYTFLNSSKDIIELISFDQWLKFIYNIPRESILEVSPLFDAAIENHSFDIAQLIILSVFTKAKDDNNSNDFYRELVMRYLSSEQDIISKGYMCYNLANAIRDVDLYESFFLYFEALKREPDYSERFYWWQEVGGVLFMTAHYFFAELFYEKAISLAPEEVRNDIIIPLSDCLVCQGKMMEALKEEQTVLSNQKRITSIVLLKNAITKRMIEAKIDIFNPTYWFNQGVKASHDNNHEVALDYFLYAWRFNDGDTESLANAFIESFNVANNQLSLIITDILRIQSPKEGFKYIVSSVTNSNLPSSTVDLILDTFKSLLFSSTNDSR